MRLINPNFEDHINNVVRLCGTSNLIFEHTLFRDYRIERTEIENINIDLRREKKKPMSLPDKPDLKKIIKVIPHSCKSWACSYCGSVKVETLLKRLHKKDLTGYRFFTLTLKSAYDIESTKIDFKIIGSHFRKLIQKLKRLPQYKDLQYIKVCEIGSGSGMVHLHGVWNKYIPVELLSKYWLSITGDSFKVYLKKIYNAKAISKYLYKYLTKDATDRHAEYPPELFSLNIPSASKLFYECEKRRFTTSLNFWDKKQKRDSNYKIYGFDAQDDAGIQRDIKYFYTAYQLKESQFDFKYYYNSELFLENLFSNPPLDPEKINYN